jgi:flagellar protein FliO/FliZ
VNAVALLALLLALGFAGWALRRRGGAAAGRPELALRERRPLARDCGLALLEVRGRALVVGYGAHGVRLVADLGPAGPGEGGRP